MFGSTIKALLIQGAKVRSRAEPNRPHARNGTGRMAPHGHKTKAAGNEWLTERQNVGV